MNHRSNNRVNPYKKTWLLLDCSYLANRAFYAMNGLNNGALGTGAIFGFFRDVVNFKQLHHTKHLAFAFDTKPYHRSKLYPAYKKRKTELPKEQLEAKSDLYRQIACIQEDLPQLGFKNVFAEKGYEADDIIAQLIEQLPSDDDAVIISSDEDYYQLLRPGVVCWNPTTHRAYDHQLLRRQFKVAPSQWPYVKALAGCSGDNVIGIDGVGDKTAAKMLTGQLSRGSDTYQKIKAQHDEMIRVNLPLVKLPYPGLGKLELREDQLDHKVWDMKMREYSISTLIGALHG